MFIEEKNEKYLLKTKTRDLCLPAAGPFNQVLERATNLIGLRGFSNLIIYQEIAPGKFKKMAILNEKEPCYSDLLVKKGG